jgi:hypothetical protein
MDEFRRSVIRIAEAIQVIGMVLATLAGAFTGMTYGRMIAFASGSQEGGAAFLGFVIGGAVSFLITTTAAAILFALSETANNTARLVELMSQTNRPQTGSTRSLTMPPASHSAPRREVSPGVSPSVTTGEQVARPVGTALDLAALNNWKGTDGESLFPSALDVLTRAIEKGYTIGVTTSSEITLQSPQTGTTFCRSNSDILSFGRFME